MLLLAFASSTMSRAWAQALPTSLSLSMSPFGIGLLRVLRVLISSKVLQQVAPDKLGRLTWIAVDHLQEQKWGRIRSTAAMGCRTKCIWAFALSTSSCTPCTSTVMPSGSPSRVEWLQARKGLDCGGRKAFGKSLRVAHHSTCKNTGYEETSGAWLSYELGAVLDAAQRKS